MPSLHKKLLRELWRMRGQVLAIALVIVGGVGVCVMSLSTYDSLKHTRDNYYANYRFADVFADLTRAPLSLAARLRDIPGVVQLEPRVSAPIKLIIDNFDEPVTGLAISLPPAGTTQLNKIHLRAGRLPSPHYDNEVLVSDAFAEAHQLATGNTLGGVINGRLKALRIVGIALSPEHIYQIAPGSVFPDYQRYGVLWMAYRPLATAYDMQGAFNNVVLSTARDASNKQVMQQLDTLLEPYGGHGAYTRAEQHSNQFLQEEFNQLQTMAVLFPVIFLGVAIFLLNVVVGRLIGNEREIIAVLKAFGYSNRQIGWHYLLLTIIITSLGIIAGFGLGYWLGQLMTEVFATYYRFPALLFATDPLQTAAVMAICYAATIAGTLRPVLAAASLAPAAAMQPAAPAVYRRALVERMPLAANLSQASRMILRNMERQGIKTLLAIIGLAAACGVMMVGNFQQDAVDKMLHVQFKLTQKEDIAVSFDDALAKRALYSLDNVPGVNYVEGLRIAPATLRFEHREYRSSVTGFAHAPQLRQLRDANLNTIAIPAQGLLVTDHLAHKLGFSVGDRVEVEFIDGAQKRKQVEVAGLTSEYLGLGSYMALDALNRLIGEGPAVNSALLSIDQQHAQDIYQRLRDMPAIIAINLRQTVIDAFNESLQRILVAFTLINATLGAVIAFGVVYNTMRIAFAERARELASLRVLGYTRGEVAYTLLGELALLTLISLPLGFALGALLCDVMSSGLQSDLYRVPLVLAPRTYGFSALVVIVSALFSGLIIWRRICHLDLVHVLKTRE
ncbi:MAG: FtsX-like permease family protein [Pseudomonadales bacterium]|nr:FtsX-like permease family protein [Gammaproteobacteria bacterium]NNL56244.1 FtsX-like permease family protein [Pseudomonadales bacterium]